MYSEIVCRVNGLLIEIQCKSIAEAMSLQDEHPSLAGSKTERSDNFLYAPITIDFNISDLREEVSPIPVVVGVTAQDGYYYVTAAREAGVLSQFMDEVDALITSEGEWESVEDLPADERVQFLFSDLDWDREAFVAWLHSMQFNF